MPAVENHLHVFPALRPLRARHVGVCEFVDHHYLRMITCASHRVRVHLLELRPAMFEHTPRHELEAFSLRNRIRAPMRFKIADYDIVPLALQFPRLATASGYVLPTRRVTKKDFELAPCHANLGTIAGAGGNTRTSMPSAA